MVKKEHPVNAPIGLGREVAREYCRFVNTFTKHSILKILVIMGYGVGVTAPRPLCKIALVLILVVVGYGVGVKTTAESKS